MQHRSQSARSAAVPKPRANGTLAQRRSTLGREGSVAAPPIVDAGRPLDAGARGAMEAGFGRDFANIRVHDDARAHDNARALSALAYAAGDHIVFGEGAYRPDSMSGRALIAHELAHSVQQGGVQMKADGPMPAHADAELEAQADRAAADVIGGRTAGALTRIDKPAVFRATTPLSAGSATDLPSDVELIKEEPRGPGATLLIVALPVLKLPNVKGKGPWVQEGYSAMAAGGRLLFSPIFDGKKNYGASDSIRAYMEKPGEKYKDVWLNNYGFKNLSDVATAIRAAKKDPKVKAALKEPGVEEIVTGFAAGRLTDAGCDIDHVVEKQVGGTSVPGNLQLLLSDKNQASGRDTYAQMVAEVTRILEPRREKVVRLQIRFKTAKVPTDVPDASYHVETLLRSGKVKGAADANAKAEGTPIELLAGGASEVIYARDTGATAIDSGGERRLIPGMKLVSYKRGSKKGPDTVEAELASKPMLKGDKNITLSATVAKKPADADPSAGASEEAKEAASEVRKLELKPSENKDLPFYYPYLSKGKLTKLAVDDQNRFSGEGMITPSVRFLGELKIAFGPDKLDLVQDIDVAAMNASAFMRPVSPVFRFTSGKVSIDLVKFKPEGKLEFELGPKAKPVIAGAIDATAEGGAFIARGTLKPAGPVPGVKDAKGEVSYRSDTGWAGVLEATSSSIPKSTTTVRLGFKEDKGAFHAYGEGRISTVVRNANLNLGVDWRGGALSYFGGVTVEKPLPLVDRVDIKGSYANEWITLDGEAKIKWRNIDATMKVKYKRKDGDEEGKFSGSAGVDVKTEKASGHLDLAFDEEGRVSGKGTIGYQVTKDIRPTLGLELTRDGRVKVLGEAVLGDIPLGKKWPSPEGGRATLIKGAGVKFPVPTPIPSLTVFGEIRVSAGLAYGAGPVTLKGVKFNGELYPLDDDPKVKAQLKGKLAVPAYGEIYGTFGAYLGAEVLGGAAGAKGGVDITPALRIQAEAAVEVDAAYEAQAFTFSAEAYAKGQLVAKLDIDLVAEIYAAYGVLSHTWKHKAKQLEKKIGPELKLTLGRIAYGKGGEITWPDPSQITLEPKDIDPLEVVKELLADSKTQGQTVPA